MYKQSVIKFGGGTYCLSDNAAQGGCAYGNL